VRAIWVGGGIARSAIGLGDAPWGSGSVGDVDRDVRGRARCGGGGVGQFGVLPAPVWTLAPGLPKRPLKKLKITETAKIGSESIKFTLHAVRKR
jgi:hypothetical protein